MTRWQDDAACRGLPAEIFYPWTYTETTMAAARIICKICPVIDECREAGKAEKHGIWAGEFRGVRREWPRRQRVAQRRSA